MEEKASLLSGLDYWHTKPIDRLGIPSVMVSDGPHGLRKQITLENGESATATAVCYPSECLIASSFDKELLHEVGDAIGKECLSEDVSVILGPGVNIKRSPLCGRNFEYYSEDPLLAGELAASFISGVQANGVGTSIKHFAANSQEKERMTSSSVIAERTLREIYLPAFERAVKKAQPWTVMCSYNRINGEYSAGNRWLLTDVLRKEWGFEGLVVSDWGAVDDRVKDVHAGLDLEMPASGGANDRLAAEAVRNGTLSEEDLDKAVLNVLKLVFRSRKEDIAFDYEKDHQLSSRAAAESMVLLSNDGLLPLDKSAKVAFIGGFAETPRYQGGGSSHIRSYRVDSALSAAPEGVIYSKGFSASDGKTDDTLLAEAVEAAAKADAAVLFMGLPATWESEGYDRTHMELPEDEIKVLNAVLAVNKRVAVVLSNGSPVEMDWHGDVSAILEAYLGGEGGGKAIVDILYGDVNPSGHLAETFPERCEDNPSYLFYGGENGKVTYGEGIFVGYRYYDKKDIKVLFPFGHGLSYTEFEYSDLSVDKASYSSGELKVSVKVRNTGAREGKAVAQLYVRNPQSGMIRPVRELRDFAKVSLAPGEEKSVSFVLSDRDFSYFDEDEGRFLKESGIYGIEIGASSRDIRCSEDIMVSGDQKITPITVQSMIKDAMAVPGADEIFAPLMKHFSLFASSEAEGLGEGTAEMLSAMMATMPLRGIITFTNGMIGLRELEEIVDKLNEKQGLR